MQQPLSSQYKANSKAPFRGLASLLALQGRKGDTRLVHMTDREVRAMAATGRMTINPDTGLPEAFNLSSLLPIVLAIAGTMVAPGIGTALGASVGAGTVGGAVAGAIGAGVGSTAGNLLIGKSGEEALKSGLISAGTAGIGSLASGPALEALSGTAGLEGAAGVGAAGLDGTAGVGLTEGASVAGTEGLADGYASLPLPPQDAPLTMSRYYTDKAESINATRAAEQTAIDSGTPFKVTKSSTSMFGPDFKENQLLTDAQAAQATNGKYGLLTAGEGAAKDMSVGEASLENIKTLGSSKTPYIKGAISGGLGLALEPPEYKKEAPRPPPKFQDYTLAGGELLPSGEGQDAPLSSAQALAIALGEEKRKPVLSQYAYTPREASSGGLIGLFEGGKVTYLNEGSDTDTDTTESQDEAPGDQDYGTNPDTNDYGNTTESQDEAPGDQDYGTNPDTNDYGNTTESQDEAPGDQDFNNWANSITDIEEEYGPPNPNKGLAGLITGYLADKVEYAKNNPIATALDAAFGFAPGIGWANTISGVLGGPTVGKGLTAMGRGIGQAISPDMSPEAIDARDAKAAYDYSFGKDKSTESFDGGGYGQQDSATLKRKREEEEAFFKEGGPVDTQEFDEASRRDRYKPEPGLHYPTQQDVIDYQESIIPYFLRAQRPDLYPYLMGAQARVMPNWSAEDADASGDSLQWILDKAASQNPVKGTPETERMYAEAVLAAGRNPFTEAGFDPTKITFDSSGVSGNMERTLGVTSNPQRGKKPTSYVSYNSVPTAMHEAIHRLPESEQTGPSEKAYMGAVRKMLRLPDTPHIWNELLVRRIMDKDFDNIEVPKKDGWDKRMDQFYDIIQSMPGKTLNEKINKNPINFQEFYDDGAFQTALSRFFGSEIDERREPIERELAKRNRAPPPPRRTPLLGRRGLKEGGSLSYHEGRVDGAGDGMSDNVVYRVEGGNPDIAMLSRDEYVLPADVVAMIGNGSSNAGSDKIDKFIKDLRKQSFGTAKQQREVKNSSKTGLSTLVH